MRKHLVRQTACAIIDGRSQLAYRTFGKFFLKNLILNKSSGLTLNQTYTMERGKRVPNTNKNNHELASYVERVSSTWTKTQVRRSSKIFSRKEKIKVKSESLNSLSIDSAFLLLTVVEHFVVRLLPRNRFVGTFAQRVSRIVIDIPVLEWNPCGQR